MDLYCQVCNAEWDFFSVMDDHGAELEPLPEGETRNAKTVFLAGDGCPSCDWGKQRPKRQSLRSATMGALAELLGDDVDGLAATMEDFEMAGAFACDDEEDDW